MVVDGIMLDKTSAKDEPTGRCSDCGCSFSSRPQSDSETPLPSSHSSLAKQRRSHKAEKPSSKCPTCEARPALPNGRRPHRQVRPDPHSCTMCSKTFISSIHLALHMASHRKDKKHRCGICGKCFNQPSNLMAHKSTHSGERPFKCPECGKGFGRAAHLKTHRKLHTGEKPFKCTYCEKAFVQKVGLISHMRLHTGERPSKCAQCGDTFPSLSHLLSHQGQDCSERTNAQESYERAKPVSASVPNQQQKTGGNLDDLKCGVCCRTFVRSSYIRLCIRLNKGQRPYHCKVCNKTFVKLDTFVNHCDKHLRQKKMKSEQVKEEVVKPPVFVPLSRPPSPLSSSAPAFSEVNTRSRAKAKSKMY